MHITVPGVRGTMILISILISVSALRVFSELFILTGGKGGPGGRDNSVVMLIQQYSQGFEGNLGYASALSIVLFFVTVVPMLVLARLNRKERSMSRHRSGAAGAIEARYAAARGAVVRVQHRLDAEKVVRYVLLVFVLLITIGPFLWQLSTSLKGSGEDIYTRIPRLLPAEPTFDHYGAVADTIPVWDYAKNSLVVAVLVVGGNVLGASLAGFALSRLQFRGPQAGARAVPGHAGAAG